MWRKKRRQTIYLSMSRIRRFSPLSCFSFRTSARTWVKLFLSLAFWVSLVPLIVNIFNCWFSGISGLGLEVIFCWLAQKASCIITYCSVTIWFPLASFLQQSKVKVILSALKRRRRVLNSSMLKSLQANPTSTKHSPAAFWALPSFTSIFALSLPCPLRWYWYLCISEITKHNYLKNGSAISDSDLICNHLILQEIPMFLLHFGSQILP